MDNESLTNPSGATDNKEALASNQHSEKAKKQKPVKPTGFRWLGNIVKVIGFFVALVIIAVHVLAAYILFNYRPLYIPVCFIIVTVGFVIALIALFLIYALGHSINQNNEILYLLKKDNEK